MNAFKAAVVVFVCFTGGLLKPSGEASGVSGGLRPAPVEGFSFARCDARELHETVPEAPGELG